LLADYFAFVGVTFILEYEIRRFIARTFYLLFRRGKRKTLYILIILDKESRDNNDWHFKMNIYYPFAPRFISRIRQILCYEFRDHFHDTATVIYSFNFLMRFLNRTTKVNYRRHWRFIDRMHFISTLNNHPNGITFWIAKTWMVRCEQWTRRQTTTITYLGINQLGGCHGG